MPRSLSLLVSRAFFLRFFFLSRKKLTLRRCFVFSFLFFSAVSRLDFFIRGFFSFPLFTRKQQATKSNTVSLCD